MSDPIRTADYIAWAESLPKNCAFIYRFNKFDSETAKALSQIARDRHQQFIIRHSRFDPQSDGSHFKRKTALQDIRLFREKHPEALLSLAALKTEAYNEPLPDIDGLFVSSIFKSKSPSAGNPIGVQKLRNYVKAYNVPIFALGGINTETVKELRETGIAGIAAIGGLEKKENMTDQTLEISKHKDGNNITFIAKYPNSDIEAILELSYVRDKIYNAHHTGVPKAMGGKGVGTALVKAMSEDAQEHNYKIIPGCPFVAVWFKRKPEWAAMAALEPEKFKR